MGLTHADLIGEMSEEERQSRKEWLDRCSSNDIWAKKYLKNIGILMTSHQGNRAFLKACVESHKKLGYWICLAYDNFIEPNWQEIDYNRFMPAKDVMDNIDTFIVPHSQNWGGVLYPFFWLLKLGVNAMQDFEYLYCVNGDCIIEKPEGFQQLFSLLGDADIMTCGPDRDDPPAANTVFIARTFALKKIVQHFQDHFIPFENYERYTQEIGNTEGRLGRAIKDLKLKQIRIEPPDEDMFRIPGKGTWWKLLGFRHLHAELNYSYRYKGIPPPSKYLDERFTSENDLKYIKLYEETQDINILKDWWAKE